MDARCPLCRQPGGEVLWRDAVCRVVLVDEPALPAYCRVIWNSHRREISDLSVGERRHLQRVVDAVEATVRELARPDKINVASLGNVVPHLHVHIVPRFVGDPWWPGPTWTTPTRAAAVRRGPGPAVLTAILHRMLGPG